MEINFLQMRLQQTLSKCLLEFNEEFIFQFDPKKKQLTFVLDLGIDRDPDFSGPVTAVFTSNQNNFTIDYFSIQNPDKQRSETLIKDIEKIDFYFYDAISHKWIENKINIENTLPTMLKIIVHKNSQKIDFAYIFAQSDPIALKI